MTYHRTYKGKRINRHSDTSFSVLTEQRTLKYFDHEWQAEQYIDDNKRDASKKDLPAPVKVLQRPDYNDKKIKTATLIRLVKDKGEWKVVPRKGWPSSASDYLLDTKKNRAAINRYLAIRRKIDDLEKQSERLDEESDRIMFDEYVIPEV